MQFKIAFFIFELKRRNKLDFIENITYNRTKIGES